MSTTSIIFSFFFKQLEVRIRSEVRQYEQAGFCKIFQVITFKRELCGVYSETDKRQKSMFHNSLTYLDSKGWRDECGRKESMQVIILLETRLTA